MSKPKLLSVYDEVAQDGDVVTSKLDTVVAVTQNGTSLVVSESILVKDGAKITFKAPCNSESIESITINGVVYTLCLYDGCSISTHKLTCFTANTYVTVTLNTVDSKAYIVNGYEKTKVINATLGLGSWEGSSAPYTCELIIDGVTDTSIQEILPALDITKEQLEALQLANIVDGGQSKGYITLKAFGTKPTINIPIRVLLRGER